MTADSFQSLRQMNVLKRLNRQTQIIRLCGTCVYQVTRWDCFQTWSLKQTVSNSFGKQRLLAGVFKIGNDKMMK